MRRATHVLSLAILSSGLLAGTAGMPAWGQDCPTTNDGICNEPDSGDATCKAGTDTADCSAASAGDTDSGGDDAWQAQLLTAGSLFEAFEIAEPHAPSGGLSYDSVAPIGENGIEFSNLVISDGGDTIAIDRLVANNVDWRRMMDDSIPTFMNVEVEGLAIPADLMDLDAMAQSVLGDVISTDMLLDYSIENGVMDVRELALNMPGLATIGFAMSAGGVNPDADDFDSMMIASTINNAELVFQDAGLVALILEMAGGFTGMGPEETAQMAVMQLQLMGGQATSPAAQSSMQALTSFLQAGTTPDGTLTVTANPSTPFSPLALMAAGDPDSAVEILGLSIDYQ